jgi:hypothetical protein
MADVSSRESFALPSVGGDLERAKSSTLVEHPPVLVSTVR